MAETPGGPTPGEERIVSPADTTTESGGAMTGIRNNRLARWGGGTGLAILAVGAAFLVGNRSNGDSESTGATTTLTVTAPGDTVTAPAAVTAPEECEGSWRVNINDRGELNRFVAEGFAPLSRARTKAQAERAAFSWLRDVVKGDPVLLDGAAQVVLGTDADKYEPADLRDDNCISPEGVALFHQLEGALSTADFSPDDPSASALNTGVSNGNVVAAATPGITGDRSGVTMELENGDKLGLMARCANLTKEGDTPLPEGPTDNPEPPEPDTPGEPDEPTPTTTTTPDDDKCPGGVCPPDPSADTPADADPSRGPGPRRDVVDDTDGIPETRDPEPGSTTAPKVLPNPTTTNADTVAAPPIAPPTPEAPPTVTVISPTTTADGTVAAPPPPPAE